MSDVEREFHVCDRFGCCGTPIDPPVIPVDPDAPRYRPAAGPGVETREVAPGVWVVSATDDDPM